MKDKTTLLYQGHASLRIVTEDKKVIYIDPFDGEGYDLPADLILVTHGHFDHTYIDKIESRAEGCEVIMPEDALRDKNFDLDFVKVRAVQAGNNKNHSIKECVGYVLTFKNGKKIYISGDTSTTDEMPQLAQEHIDYAFFCCDGVYNMDMEEAAKCARLVGAAHNIPYHMLAAHLDVRFTMERAQQFDAPGRLIIKPGEELVVE